MENSIAGLIAILYDDVLEKLLPAELKYVV